VAVAGRTPSDLEFVVAEISAANGTAVPIPFDAVVDAECERAISASVQALGGIDAIIINHGVTLHAAAIDTSPTAFRDVVNVNLCSAFVCATAAARQMISQGKGGSVVFISSTASFLAFDGLSAYGASKGGMDQLTRQLASEWAPHRIRVNAIGPGWMNSHMRGVEAEYETESFRAELMRKIPMQRRGEPEELVGAAIFMISSGSTYMTGQYVAVDGGNSLI
jgi:NAD(P)-dependent dehydrogenase (short-subunit alcohol dehydrogenase family)